MATIDSLTKVNKPFYTDKNITITVDRNEDNQITGFNLTYKGDVETFPVIKNRIKEAWINMEKALIKKG